MSYREPTQKEKMHAVMCYTSLSDVIGECVKKNYCREAIISALIMSLFRVTPNESLGDVKELLSSFFAGASNAHEAN